MNEGGTPSAASGGEAAALGATLFVTSSFPRWPGDAASPFVLHLAQDLRSLGWDVTVLAPHAPGAARREVLEGVPVLRFEYCWPETTQTLCYGGGALRNVARRPRDRLKVPLLVGAQLLAIWRALGERRFDIVHSHWLLPQGFTAGAASRLRRVPHVATVHGGDAFALRGRAAALFKRAALSCSDAVTVNSSATAAIIEPLLPRASIRPERIAMGAYERAADATAVARLRERYRRGRGPLLVFVGRLVAEKGVEDFVRALAFLRPRFPDATAIVVGDGPDRQSFADAARDAGVSDRVEWLGWLSPADVAAALAAADCFVGPSRTRADGWVEAQGVTFAEAMLAGTPVIATRVGGIPDLVRDGETGLLVDERSPGAIAAAVVRLVENPSLASRLASAGRSTALAGYTRSACAAAFSRLYVRVLREAPCEVPQRRR